MTALPAVDKRAIAGFSLAIPLHALRKPSNPAISSRQRQVSARTDFDANKLAPQQQLRGRRRPRQQTPDRKLWSAGERPPDAEPYPPGKLPLSLELDFVLNHPFTDFLITFFVILNCVVFALQTIDVGPTLHEVFRSYENSISVLFLMEYFGRWYGKGLSPRFLLTRGMLIDFLAVAPIGFAFADQSEALFVRMLRLIRIFRLERMVMDTESSKGKMKGMTFIQIQLASIGLSLFSLLYVSAGLFYQVEKDVNPEVRNFFDAFYYSTITLFTVGFGDVTPLTSWGRIITVLTVLTGAVLIPFKISEVERVRQLGKGRESTGEGFSGRQQSIGTRLGTPMFSVEIEDSEHVDIREVHAMPSARTSTRRQILS